MKYTLQGNNRRVDKAENQISYWEDKEAETPNQNSKKKKKKSKKCLRRLWDDFKHTNICIMGVLGGEEEEQGIENIFLKMIENIPNLAKEINIQVQEAQRG